MTNYYKNLCNELQEKINIIEANLNKINNKNPKLNSAFSKTSEDKEKIHKNQKK
jgi:hypothetical protein